MLLSKAIVSFQSTCQSDEAYLSKVSGRRRHFKKKGKECVVWNTKLDIPATFVTNYRSCNVVWEVMGRESKQNKKILQVPWMKMTSLNVIFLVRDTNTPSCDTWRQKNMDAYSRAWLLKYRCSSRPPSFRSPWKQDLSFPRSHSESGSYLHLEVQTPCGLCSPCWRPSQQLASSLRAVRCKKTSRVINLVTWAHFPSSAGCRERTATVS